MDNVREKAIELVHFLREVISNLLAELNRGLAAALTTAALACLKHFLKENTELEDLKRATAKVGKDIQTSTMKLISGFRDNRTESSDSVRREAVRAVPGEGSPPQNEDAVRAVEKSGGNTIEAAVAAVLSGKLSKVRLGLKPKSKLTLPLYVGDRGTRLFVPRRGRSSAQFFPRSKRCYLISSQERFANR